MIYLINNLFSQILALLIAGVLALLVFSIFNRFVYSLVEEKRSIVTIQWTRIQIVFWVLYSVVLYSLLFRFDYAMTSIVTIIVVGLGWSYWKDVFAGMLMKLENKFNTGEVISTDYSKGILQSINISQSSIINDVGELVLVPNSKLRNGVVTQHKTISDASIFSVDVKTRKGQTMDEIYQYAYECPYLSANKKISIERQRDNEFSIRASIIDSSFIEQANSYFDDLANPDRTKGRGA